MASRIYCVCMVLTMLVGSACGRRQAVSRPPAAGRLPASTGGNGAPETVRPGYTEEGYASWYGDPYHGRRAANGEIYDKNKLTAAHLTLPFGTRTKVTNLETNRSVEVRITDRGPFVKGRIIDLSQEAARQVRMIGTGTALVRLEVLAVSGAPAAGSYAVQVGAFRERSTAERLQQSLRDRYGSAFVEPYESSEGLFYRVRVGPKPSVLEARRLAAQLGNENLPTFVVRLNN